MREMKWTYDELMSTPAEVVLDLTRYMSTENKWREMKQKEAERRVK